NKDKLTVRCDAQGFTGDQSPSATAKDAFNQDGQMSGRKTKSAQGSHTQTLRGIWGSGTHRIGENCTMTLGIPCAASPDSGCVLAQPNFEVRLAVALWLSSS